MFVAASGLAVRSVHSGCSCTFVAQEGRRFQAIFVDGMHLYDYTLVVRDDGCEVVRVCRRMCGRR
jgi:hypothetical protein